MLAPAGRTWTSLRLLAAVAVLGVCLYFLTRQIEPALLGRALARADYRLVAVMTAAHLALFLSIKAWRWQILLAPIQRLPLTKLYQYCLAGCAITNLFPARAGQAVRVVLLRQDAVPVASSIGVLALEEISNAAVLGLLCLPLPFLLSLPARVHFTLGFVTGGAALALGLLAWLALAGRGRPGGLLRRISEGVAVLGRGRAALAVLGLTVAMWLVDLGQIALAMWAVGMTPSYAGVALVLLFVNLTNAFPATPGQVGLFEAGATAACVALGATPERGLAVGVLYHFTQLIPETVLGLAVLGRGALGRVWRAARVEAASES
jgi:uncharacterized membrane protein YbhN (UPF0104 family)